MARTAIVIGLLHGADKQWKLLLDPSTPIVEAKAKFHAEFAGKASHPDFQTVMYQESDGPARILRFVTPDQAKANSDRAKSIEEQMLVNQKAMEARLKKQKEDRLKGIQDRSKAEAASNEAIGERIKSESDALKNERAKTDAENPKNARANRGRNNQPPSNENKSPEPPADASATANGTEPQK